MNLSKLMQSWLYIAFLVFSGHDIWPGLNTGSQQFPDLVIERFLKNHPNPPRGVMDLLLETFAAHRRGDYLRAVRGYEKLLAIYKNDDAILYYQSQLPKNH